MFLCGCFTNIVVSPCFTITVLSLVEFYSNTLYVTVTDSFPTCLKQDSNPRPCAVVISKTHRKYDACKTIDRSTVGAASFTAFFIIWNYLYRHVFCQFIGTRSRLASCDVVGGGGGGGANRSILETSHLPKANGNFLKYPAHDLKRDCLCLASLFHQHVAYFRV